MQSVEVPETKVQDDEHVTKVLQQISDLQAGDEIVLQLNELHEQREIQATDVAPFSGDGRQSDGSGAVQQEESDDEDDDVGGDEDEAGGKDDFGVDSHDFYF